ncbi:MAG TPA: SgcJ/EcaC family oxidoreductase [Steroidobacteraceae bacterium]|nr:SgcJ/EcaC family oxidoreductase [Steroidobacteraceae bacterium]
MKSTDEQQIRDLVATWMAATKAGDVATVLNLMTDDVVFLVAGQPPFGKEKFAETMKGPLGKPQAHIDGRSEIQEVQVSGDMAYLWSRLTVEVTPPGGEPIKRAGHTLSVLRKSGGRWQLARDANLLTPVGI